jgi:hypothetical protein
MCEKIYDVGARTSFDNEEVDGLVRWCQWPNCIDMLLPAYYIENFRSASY